VAFSEREICEVLVVQDEAQRCLRVLRCDEPVVSEDPFNLTIKPLRSSSAARPCYMHRTLVRSCPFTEFADRPVWKPTRRNRNARQKLDGFDPVALLVDDLKQNPAVDKFNSLAALEAILRRGCP